ncbi:uncharacterized protein LOC132796637 [Drosophila nasuta]|uniref:uncharacterized protein LOC132796637 n=1 Tax=Drosophila nasuta TaxID=42062 RepID=UPI00295EF2F7|nr:uncharacterized protein LOC132796637 [Drosophila nasuta]
MKPNLKIWFFVVLLGIFAINTKQVSNGENQLKNDQFIHQKRGVQNFGSRSKRTQEWENRQKTHLINIVVTDLDKLDAQERQKEQKVKAALMKMMNLKEAKAAPKVRRHFDNAPGLDFRREFASDEPNPYIENLRNRCEQL